MVQTDAQRSGGAQLEELGFTFVLCTFLGGKSLKKCKPEVLLSSSFDPGSPDLAEAN